MSDSSMQNLGGPSVMAKPSNVMNLADLHEGICDGAVVVKVDRIYNKEIVRYPLVRPRPMRELTAVQLIIFDQSMSRNIAVMDEDAVIERIGPIFGEGKCYRISNFMVRRSGDGCRLKLYIKLLPTTHVEFTLINLPTHCFVLRTVSHILSGVNSPWGLLDVCGMLKAFVEPGLQQSNGIYSKEVVVILEDNGVLAVGSDKILYCSLIGECADTTVRAYETLSNHENVFVIIQYAMVEGTPHGGLTLTSFHNATRVFFNPTYPEVQAQRISMLHRLLPNPNSASLPLV